MIRRLGALCATVLLLATSCSGTGTSSDAESPTAEADNRPQGSILPPADPDGATTDELPAPDAVEENPDNGRLVVQTAAGQLFTVLPDGTDTQQLTDDPGQFNSQPSWAPDGSRIAWVATSQDDGSSALFTDRFDRSDTREIALETSPIYLYWDPSASKIAHLSPSPGGLDLGVAEPFGEDGPTNRRLDRGQPFFASWGPDGDELLVHASDFRLDRIDLGSATIIIDEFPGSFGAPTWLEDNSIMFAETRDGASTLVTAGVSGEGRRPLVRYDGLLRFAVSNEGNRIAMQVSPATATSDVVTASFQLPEPTTTPDFDTSLDAIDELVANVPYIMGTFGGEPFALSRNPALALVPSPDGRSVAWLEAVPGSSEAVTWFFDVRNETMFTPSFIPSSETLDDYLPFFDQYSQSHDFWSPSSSLFVYAGRPVGSAEPDGIWIFDTETRTSQRLDDGVFAAFTRTPSAGGAASAL